LIILQTYKADLETGCNNTDISPVNPDDRLCGRIKEMQMTGN
jgi:hypothetical protein